LKPLMTSRILLKRRINMNKPFVKIVDSRILISTIKRYRPVGTNVLIIRFSSSTRNTEAETFTFASKEERDNTVDMLDLLVFN
jgi:hypothetical protein